MTFCDPMDRSLSGSSVHGILQARILEWVAICFFRESSQLRDPTQVSCITGIFFFFYHVNHHGSSKLVHKDISLVHWKVITRNSDRTGKEDNFLVLR